MSRACKICVHRERMRIERDLLIHGIRPATIARELGISRPSVGRHLKNHCMGVLDKVAGEQVRSMLADSIAESVAKALSPLVINLIEEKRIRSKPREYRVFNPEDIKRAITHDLNPLFPPGFSLSKED